MKLPAFSNAPQIQNARISVGLAPQKSFSAHSARTRPSLIKHVNSELAGWQRHSARASRGSARAFYSTELRRSCGIRCTAALADDRMSHTASQGLGHRPRRSGRGTCLQLQSHDLEQVTGRRAQSIRAVTALSVLIMILGLAEGSGVVDLCLEYMQSMSQLEVVQSAGAGLLAGALHSLTGPDHLAALAPLTVGRSCSESAWFGGLWGCGHNTGQILFGIVFLLLREHFACNLDVINQYSTAMVGIMLLIIGVCGFMGAAEAEGALEEAHGNEWRGAMGKGATRAAMGTFVTGMIHGLQPDAMLVLLPALTLRSQEAGAYLVTFLGGTVLAMSSYAFFIGLSSRAITAHNPHFNKRISQSSSLIALVIGISLLMGTVVGVDLLGQAL
ncbi:hypothetical protein CYMTET_41812 [Cymbomonas tetramitiformis]|uniref:Urease accessory protein UreH-like transmembrane domain-containing protein n=1 Tax=Cymbomonas tetramitiformis TaxID=36881 RepID=A0AAE0C5C2_9CHLO|nr:hypothetical protein CYMTET_41812 [Cymbomonas tetramitiformis]